MSQFLLKALNGENVILKSDGNQYYSYVYATDAIAGFLTILLKGEMGLAYNIADGKSDVRLKELAHKIAFLAGVKLIFQMPGTEERVGFSKVVNARLDATRLNALGWNAKFDISQGISRTLEIMRNTRED